MGAADGAFLLQKERRADNAATLDISGRDQQDQRLYLKRDEERLVWELERRETELRQEPPDPVLEAVAALVTAERPEWEGRPRTCRRPGAGYETQCPGYAAECPGVAAVL